MDRSDWLCQDAQAPLGRHDACVHATGHRYAMLALRASPAADWAGGQKEVGACSLGSFASWLASLHAHVIHPMRAAPFILASQATPARLGIARPLCGPLTPAMLPSAVRPAFPAARR
jgi:hypothetical protein